MTRRLAAVLLITVLGTALAIFYCSRFHHYAIDNDGVHNLGTGFRVDPNEPFLQRLKARALSLCAPDSRFCAHYQELLTSNLTFNYPIPALYGRALVNEQSDRPYGRAVMDTVVAAAWAGLILALALCYFLGWLAPGPLLGALAIVAGAALLRFGVLEPFLPVAKYDFMIYALAVLSVGTIAWGALRARPTWRALVTLATLALLFARLPMPFFAAVTIAYCLLVWIGVRAGVGLGLAAVMALVVALSMNPYTFWLVTLPAPRSQLALVLLLLMPLAFTRPHSRWPWLLLLLPLFHVGLAGMVAAFMLAAEIIVALHRRRTTTLLFACAALVLVVQLYTNLAFSGWVGTDWQVLSRVPGVLARSPYFLVHAALGTALVLAALRFAAPEHEGTLRAAICAGGLLALKGMEGALLSGGFDILEAGLKQLTLAHNYLATILWAACAVTVVAELFGRIAPSRPRLSPALCAAVAVLAFTGISNPYPFSARLVRDWLNGVRPSDAAVARLAWDDDVYLLRDTRAANDYLTYFSLLKYKVRRAAGKFDAERASIVVTR